jgi:ABC-type multidrug transport system fused ATPase/permease subunit
MGLTYAYPGSPRGIKDIDLCLAPGSFTAIAGPPGAGKTTLLRVLLGQLPRDAGQIRWDGQLVQDPASSFVPPRCTCVAQASQLTIELAVEDVLTSLLGRGQPLPELLVLDDLSAALDVREERALWDRVFECSSFQRVSACLVVSNRRPALRRADHILVLVAGKVAAEGTLETLLETCIPMQRIWKGGRL